MAPSPLHRFDVAELPGGLRLLVARTPVARLIGLARIREPPPYGLLLPRCRSVHTFGMRFPLDVAFLDPEGRVVRLVRGVPPRRVAGCRLARHVLETPAGAADAFLQALV